MSELKPCPICGDDDEYLRFLHLCVEKANEEWLNNEVKTMIGVYTAMDFVQVVRCRDCKWCMDYWQSVYCDKFKHDLPNVDPDGFCAWGERRDEE